MKSLKSFVGMKLLRRICSCATLLLVFGHGAIGWSQARVVDIANDANDPSNLEDSEPSIAVNPLNPLEIVIVAFSEAWGASVSAPIWKSRDGGFTWTKVPQIAAPSASLAGPGDQKIDFDSTGNLFVAELGLFPVTDFIYRQTGGADAALTVGAAYGDDQPHLNLDKVGASGCFNRLYSPWLNTSLANNQSNVANSTTGGAVMSSVAAGDNSSFPNRTTRIALGPDGKSYIIYKTREGTVDANFETAHFFVRRSDDCGSTWTAIGGTSGVSVHGATAVTTWFTTNFGNSGKGSVGRARSSDAWVATDPNSGDVYAVYANRDGSGFGQLFVVRSTTQGVSWGAPVRITDGTHNSAYPEIAVAGTGTVGVLFIDYDDSGTHTIFRHHFVRSFDNGASWTDQILQTEDPSTFSPGTFRDGFLWGDYEGLTAMGKTFYGVFTGASIGRATVQQDPIFFTETAIPASSDFYVRDWTISPVTHDNGEEPSTGVWWTVSDVWNRLTNTAGAFNANDQPAHEVALDGVPNFAFTRVHRKSAASAGSPDVTVTARFLFADYGLGSNYQDVAIGTLPTLTFAAGDTVKSMVDGAGFQWSLPVTRSTHVCMAVEISSPGDPYSPELAGRAPGVSDPLIILDNNKAQINMDLPPMGEAGGEASFYALVHNPGLLAEDMTLRYQVPPEAFRKMEGSTFQVVGKQLSPLQAKGTLILEKMQPGENRWIRINYKTQPLTDGQQLPVTFEHVVDGRIINGFTLAPQGSSTAFLIRHNLLAHKAVFARMAAVFHLPLAHRTSEGAEELLEKYRGKDPYMSTKAGADEKQYVAFLGGQAQILSNLVSQLLAAEKSADSFAVKDAVASLLVVLKSNDPGRIANTHSTLLNSLDAFQTMLQKQKGDPDDLLQMVRWQKQLYTQNRFHSASKNTTHVLKESDEFIHAFAKKKEQGEEYRELLRSLLPDFRETARALGKQGAELEPYIHQIESSLKSGSDLEKMHRNFLLKLDSLAK